MTGVWDRESVVREMFKHIGLDVGVLYQCKHTWRWGMYGSTCVCMCFVGSNTCKWAAVTQTLMAHKHTGPLPLICKSANITENTLLQWENTKPHMRGRDSNQRLELKGQIDSTQMNLELNLVIKNEEKVWLKKIQTELIILELPTSMQSQFNPSDWRFFQLWKACYLKPCWTWQLYFGTTQCL